MCGIFAYTGSIDAETAGRCVSTLAHRGPDGEGIWQGKGITLGHRRLAILDLSDAGRQPMSDPTGRYWISFNGEIYNFIELRKELIKLGHHFITSTDTEVILAAFSQWKEGCLHRFNGMWAFAIWDMHEKALFISRDRFGVKPLVYAELPGGDVAVASEMKALLPALKSRTPNRDLITQMSLRSTFYYEATEECLVREIRRLPPGHSGWVRNGQVLRRRWWNTLDNIPNIPATYSDQVELLRETLKDACRIRLRSDVTVGTALSGGIDSSVVTGCIASVAAGEGVERMSNDWRHAFVASFPGTALDETNFARMVAEHTGVPLTILVIDPKKAVDTLERDLYRYEEISITSPIPFMQLYQEMKKTGVSVSLDGHGADELFSGYPNDFAYALLDAKADINAVRDILDIQRNSVPAGKQFRKTGSAYLPRYLREMARVTIKSVGRLVPKNDKAVRGHPRWRTLGYLNRALYTDTHRTILPTLLRNYDHFSMASGVEIRMPFLDFRVVTLAFALPWQAKLSGGYSKRIVRDAGAPFIPAEVAYRPTKIGFNSPTVEWFKGPLKTYVLDTVNSQKFRECTLVDSRRVSKSIHRVLNVPNPTFREGEKAWFGLAPYLWEQAFLNS